MTKEVTKCPNCEILEKEIAFLKVQNKSIKEMAQNHGSETAQWKHKFLRLEEVHMRCSNGR